MKGIDTNILLRLLLDDDREQADQAERYLARETRAEPCFVNRVVLCEVIWTLERVQRIDRSRVALAIDHLLRHDRLALEDADLVRVAAQRYQVGEMDFADALIGLSNHRHACEVTGTFDREAAKLDEFELVSRSSG
ncbi:MAG: PIN domain-containing protein [Pseudomonadota bacterium]